SCEPCPMCLGAIYWARPKEVYFAAQHSDAASAGFDDSFIYEEITKTQSERTIPFYKMDLQAKLEPFLTWETTDQKVEY
ncbi:tRNA-specific adenosine deaminase, partial [Bacillus paralicheniformis]|nr:tRNA-specific adenosine deaminase [Bacillus paralicheniformis]